MALSKRCSCPDLKTNRHPLFVIMVSINQEGLDAGVDFPSKISVATNPFLRLKQLNGPAPKRHGNKRKGAPYWQMDLAVGPFETGANALKKMWSEKSRKVDCRLVAGVKFSALITGLNEGPKPPEGSEIVIYARDTSTLYQLLHEREAQLKKTLSLAAQKIPSVKEEQTESA